MSVLLRTCSPDFAETRIFAKGFIKFYITPDYATSASSFFCPRSSRRIRLHYYCHYYFVPVIIALPRSLTSISMLHCTRRCRLPADWRLRSNDAAISRGLSNPANKPPRHDERDRAIFIPETRRKIVKAAKNHLGGIDRKFCPLVRHGDESRPSEARNGFFDISRPGPR